MPRFATIFGEFPCPFCGHKYETLNVLWGSIPGAYRIGSEIKWHHRDGQIVPPWNFSEENWNAGDSTLTHVFLRDVKAFHPDDEPRCRHCGAALGGAIVEVKDDRVVQGRLLKPNEMPEGIYFRAEADGHLVRMREWEAKLGG